MLFRQMPMLRAFDVVSLSAAALVFSAAASSAKADPALLASQWVTAAEPVLQLDMRWPSVPDSKSLSLEDQITQRIDSLGERWSRDSFRLQIDARHRRARLELGNGSSESLSLQIASDIQFDDADTYVQAHFDLRFHGKSYKFSLPAIEMSPASYRGDYGVEIKLPLLQRKF